MVKVMYSYKYNYGYSYNYDHDAANALIPKWRKLMQILKLK